MTFAVIAGLAWIVSSWSKGGDKDDSCGPT
jgi:hypothetical protein